MANVRVTTAGACTVDRLATAAAVGLLRKGGSAVDAAIGANAVMAVVAQHLCGMGGDLFALVHVPGAPAPFALSAVGRAPTGADAAARRALGQRHLGFKGDPGTVTVPGCVDGWLALHARFGRLPLDEVLAPAIDAARHGFAASPLLVASAQVIAREPGAEDYLGLDHPGQRVTRARLADLLAAVVTDGRDGYYGGSVADDLLAGWPDLFDRSDFATDLAVWDEPLAVDALGHRIFTVPPPSQGYLALSGAWLAERTLADGTPADDPAWVHALVEASRAAGHDRPAVLFDGADGRALVHPDRLAPRLDPFDPDRAARWPSPPTADGDTTYLNTIDGDGMAVSLIQSNASGFGAHLFLPTSGLSLHNRGMGFSLAEGHPAEWAPGRRPPHTLSPLLVSTEAGELAAVVGTMGGDAQPQILLQLLVRLLVEHQDPAAAVAAGRFTLAALPGGRGDDGTGAPGFDTWDDPDRVLVRLEGQTPADWATGLEQRGHRVAASGAFDGGFGHAHVIVPADDHLVLAADPRAPGAAADGW